MMSPMALGRRKTSRAKNNQAKQTMVRYSKASSIAYSQRQEQILSTYLQSRPAKSRRPSPYRTRASETRDNSQERKIITDFYPILQSYGCTMSPSPNISQLPHVE